MIRLTTTRLLPVRSAIRSIKSFLVTVVIFYPYFNEANALRKLKEPRGRAFLAKLKSPSDRPEGESKLPTETAENTITYTTATSSRSARVL